MLINTQRIKLIREQILYNHFVTETYHQIASSVNYRVYGKVLDKCLLMIRHNKIDRSLRSSHLC